MDHINDKSDASSSIDELDKVSLGLNGFKSGSRPPYPKKIKVNVKVDSDDDLSGVSDEDLSDDSEEDIL